MARAPLGPGPRSASGPRPLLRHQLTHPGISTLSPNSVLVRRSRRHALSPRSPSWRDAGAAFSVRLRLGSPPPHSPSRLRMSRQGPWPDGEQSPNPTCRCGGPARVAVERERRCGPRGLECGYSAFHGQIRRLRQWPEDGGGSCRCLQGFAGLRGREDRLQSGASPTSFAAVWDWAEVRSLHPPGPTGALFIFHWLF